MSDYTITPEGRGYRPALVTTPFYPSIQTTVEGEGEDAATVYKAKFNQGYVYEHSVGLISPITISNMDTNYTIETNKKYIFYVELNVDSDNNVSNAAFDREEAEVDGEDPQMPSDTDSVKHFEVCKMEGLSLTSVKLRENIHWSGSSGGGDTFTHPWKATANGNDTISVAAGVIYGFIPRSDAAGGTTSSAAYFFAPFVADYKKFAGASIQITESSGYIYAKCDLIYADEGHEGGGGSYDTTQQIYRPSEVATLFFSDMAPTALDPSSDDFGSAKDVYIPVAEVSLSGGVASVDYQILTHNPMIQLDNVRVIEN